MLGISLTGIYYSYIIISTILKRRLSYTQFARCGVAGLVGLVLGKASIHHLEPIKS